MHRRSFLAATMPATAALIAFPANAAQPALDPRERLDAAIAELKAAVAEVYPQVIRWADLRYEDEGHPAPITLMALGFVQPDPPKFTGPGVYEFQILDEDGRRTTSPVAFLDWAPRRAGWYRWQHHYKGSFQGRGHYVPAARVRIVKRMEALE